MLRNIKLEKQMKEQGIDPRIMRMSGYDFPKKYEKDNISTFIFLVGIVIGLLLGIFF